jgi:hypothetical protein
MRRSKELHQRLTGGDFALVPGDRNDLKPNEKVFIPAATAGRQRQFRSESRDGRQEWSGAADVATFVRAQPEPNQPA